MDKFDPATRGCGVWHSEVAICGRRRARAFGGVVGETHAPILKEESEARPSLRKHPANRRRPRLDAFGALARRLARPGFGESGDFCDEGFGVVSFGIEVAVDPFCQLGVAFVLWICDGVEQFGITKATAAVLGRTAAAHFDQARIEHAGFRIDDAFDLDRVLPAATEVAEIDEFLRVDVFKAVVEPRLARIKEVPLGSGVLKPTSPARIS
jgi:hypothetical protein